MSRKTAFIGCGNMGGAILRAVSGVVDPSDIFITDADKKKTAEYASSLGVNAADGNAEAVRKADIIFLCVKPQIMGIVLDEISGELENSLKEGKEKLLVSIAAGLTLDTLRGMLKGEAKKTGLIRMMQNTPVSIGEGMVALTPGEGTDPGCIDELKDILKKAGKTKEIPEKEMDAFTVLSGCTPAYVYMFIDALADAACVIGVPRDRALDYITQTIKGSVKMVEETKKHPQQLKDEVCSPGGSTIAGVAKLEENGFRSSVLEAISEAYKKTADLGQS